MACGDAIAGFGMQPHGITQPFFFFFNRDHQPGSNIVNNGVYLNNGEGGQGVRTSILFT